MNTQANFKSSVMRQGVLPSWYFRHQEAFSFKSNLSTPIYIFAYTCRCAYCNAADNSQNMDMDLDMATDTNIDNDTDTDTYIYMDLDTPTDTNIDIDTDNDTYMDMDNLNGHYTKQNTKQSAERVKIWKIKKAILNRCWKIDS